MENLTTTIEDMTKEILVSNDLDFTILKLPMFAKLNETVTVPSSYYGLYNSKSGNIINTVKDSYTVTQNDEIVKTVLLGMQGFGELSVKKAGSINDGRKVFIQLEIDGFSKVGGDTIKKYITIIDSNDGSTGLSVGIGNLTMSCQNQFFKFYKSGQVKFRHTVTIAEKVRTLPTLIKNALSESMKLIELYNKFQSTPITRNLANDLVRELVGIDKTASTKELSEASGKKIKAMETLYANIENQINDKQLNLWGLFSGVTRWTTHEKSSPRRENGRLESIMVGTNYNTNQLALEFCTKRLQMQLA